MVASLELYLQALDGLHSGTSDQAKKAASGRYLEEFQKSPESWTIIHTILASSAGEFPSQARMFSAQTLRSKISYDLHQIPQADRLGLKASVVDLLKRNIHESKAVSVQLSVALADLALQVLDWHNVVGEMVETFGQSSESMPCLLEFLKVLPEELSDPRHALLTDDEFHARTTELLSDNSAKILQLLLNYLQSETIPSNQQLIFECFNSWLKEISVEQIVGTPLPALLFSALNNDDTFEPAVECICSVIRETRDIETFDIIHELYPRVVALKERFTGDAQDPQVFEGLTKIFAESGEAWHVLIAKAPRDFRDLVECIGLCAALDEDLDVVRYTFYFWYSLKQMIVMPNYSEARSVLGDIYLKLIGIIINHMQYPAGEAESDLFRGDREEEEKFRAFRHEIGDVLKDCCAVVGTKLALTEPYNRIRAGLDKLQAGQSSVTWQEIEAPLFSIRAMGMEVDMKEDEVLPNIMKTLVHLPENTKIRYAATLVLGRYTAWTALHPDYLDFQLQYIIAGFEVENADVIRAAALALMYFCQDCSSLLAKYIDQLYPFYEKMLGHVDLDSLYEVTTGIAHIIREQPVENVYQCLQHFGKPILSRLVELSQKPASDELHRSIADTVELLTIFVKHVRVRVQVPAGSTADPSAPGVSTFSPVVQFVTDVFPVAKSLLENHGTASCVAERIAKFIRNSLHSCGSTLQPLLPAIADTLAGEFARTRFGCYLWVSGTLVQEFSDSWDPDLSSEVKESVWQFGQHQSYSFFKILASTDPRQLPDLVEDFFHLARDLVMYFPQKLILSQWFSTLGEAALTSLVLDEKEPLTAVLHFLQDAFAYGGDRAPSGAIQGPIPLEIKTAVTGLVVAQGQRLTAGIVTGLLYSFPRDLVHDASATLLVAYGLVPSDMATQWLSASLDTLPQGSVSAEEKSKLLLRVSTSMQSKDLKRVRSILRDFATVFSRRNLTPRTQALPQTNTSSFSFSG